MNDKNKVKNSIINYVKRMVTIVLGIIIFLIMFYQLKISFVGITSKNEILSNIINFIAISTGFLMTTLSILASASNSRVMKKLAKYKKIKQINMFFVEPIVVSIFLITTCIVEIGLQTETVIENIVAAMICALVFIFILDFLRIGYLCINILQEIMEENFKESKREKAIKPDTTKAFLNK